VIPNGRLEAVNRLLYACPSFPDDWRTDAFYFDDDGNPLGYIVIGALCARLVDRLEQGDNSELRQVLDEAERLAHADDDYARGLALAGVVEDLYNHISHGVYEGRALRPEWVRDLLGPECRAQWDVWDTFTNGFPDESADGR
jgi:hypothetical protein